MGGLHVCVSGEPARAALERTVATVKGADALAPVTVVPPSPFAGLALRRALARRAPAGLVNVRFLPLARVAELVGAPVLTGSRPLTAALRAEAVRAVLTDDPGAFAAVAHHPATVRSLESTFRELRQLQPAARAAMTVGPDPAASVARLFEAFRARTREFHDEDDLAGAAGRAIDSGSPALAELGHVVLYLPGRLSPAEWSLVAGLARRGALTAILERSGDADVATVLEAPAEARFAELLGSPSPTSAAPEPAVAAATAIVNAPDPEDEARAVVRMVVARVRSGTPLHRIAVLYRQADPYARLAREQLTAARVAWNGPGARRLADSVAGRVLHALVRLPDGDFRRDQVAAFLAAGPVLDPDTGAPVPAARWDVLSRRAGVVGGLEQWRDRLARSRRASAAEIEAARADDEVPDATIRRLESDVEQLDRLAAFVAGAGVRLHPPAPADWPALAAWARGLLRAYLGSEGHRRAWPEIEVEAAQRVEQALDGLAALAQIRGGADVATFVQAMESELEASVGRAGRFGVGVFAGPVAAAAGGDFDVVYVLGCSEGSFPPRSRDDPVLPERDRDAAGSDGVARRLVHRAEERRDYLAALAAAPERVLTFPRADTRAQRKRLPSRWLVESAEILAGRRFGAEELTTFGATSWLHVIPSFEAGVCGGAEPGSVGEYDLRDFRAWRSARRPLARHPVVAGDPRLAAGVAAVDARRSRRFTPFDGVVGATPALRPSPEQPLSPTSLEDWARCPFRYLLGRVLRLRELERPEETDTISALERGSLVHAVLEEFVKTAAPRTSPGQRWSSEERAQLLAIGERQCDVAEAAGITGRPLQWRLERRRILRDLATVLTSDEHVRAELGVVPSASGQEVDFGRGGRPPLVVTLPDGRAVAFRGRIDRIDRSVDGSRAVVLDYKTGAPARDDPLDELRAGRRLQLPVYALAADALAGDDAAKETHAYYWYLARPGVDGLHGYELDDEALGEFHDVLATILDGVEDGVFPAYPGAPRGDRRGRETFDNCAYCPFDRVCPPGRDDLWERKRDDPVAAGFRALVEPGDEPEDEDEAAAAADHEGDA
jgi:ATP-dependent helicase/nuclease subunit B